MKRIITTLAILIALGFAVQVGLRAASEVTSVNVVGYLKISVPSNGFSLVSLNFESVDGSAVTLSNLVGTQLPIGSKAYIWDRQGKTYIGSTRMARGAPWQPLGTNLLRGDAFWLNVPPPSATGLTHEVVFMGEVPSSTGSDATTTVNNIQLDAVGHPYPVDAPWTNTTLAKNAAIGDKIHVWKLGGGYDTYTRMARGSAWGAGSNLVIKAGQAFWFQTTSGITNWTELVPYNL